MATSTVRKPIPLIKFAATVAGTSEEIWLGILRASHNTEKHDISEWKALVDTYRNKIVTRG